MYLSAMPHGIDFLLGNFRDVTRFSGALIGDSLNICACRCNFTQHALVSNDVRVFAHTGSCRRDIHQLCQIRSAARIIIQTVHLELIEHSHGINADGVREHGENRLKNTAVFLRIKVLRPQQLNNLWNTRWVDQHRSNDRLFRFYRLRQLPRQQFIHRHASSLLL